MTPRRTAQTGRPARNGRQTPHWTQIPRQEWQTLRTVTPRVTEPSGRRGVPVQAAGEAGGEGSGLLSPRTCRPYGVGFPTQTDSSGKIAGFGNHSRLTATPLEGASGSRDAAFPGMFSLPRMPSGDGGPKTSPPLPPSPVPSSSGGKAMGLARQLPPSCPHAPGLAGHQGGCPLRAQCCSACDMGSRR